MKKLEIKAKTSQTSEMFIYGDISKYEISADMVAKALRSVDEKVQNLDVRIFSGGGDVFQGIAIYNLIKQAPQKVTVHIDGLAGSIASIIMLAGDEVVIGEGSQVFIHKPFAYAVGNSLELMDLIDQLDRIENEMVRIYKNKMDLPESQIVNMLSKETWFNAQEALDFGIVDRQVEASAHMDIAASVKDKEWIKKKHLANANREFQDSIGKKINEINEFLDR